MIPTALQDDHNILVRYIINGAKISKTTKRALTATNGFLPAERHGLQGGASRESPVPYGVDRPEVQCAQYIE
jgi:hypothetical protein